MPDVNSNVAINTSDNLVSQKTSSEILELLPQERPGGEPPPTVESTKDSSTTLPLPFPDLPGLGFEWLPTTQKTILDRKPKILLAHTKLLASGTSVEQIKHETFGRWRGCQCPDCKTSRNENNDKGTTRTDPMANPKAMGSFITEKFFGRFLCLPNETMKAIIRFKHYPKEAEECWNVPAEDVKIYEEFGKFVMENYLNLEDYKHAQLVAFGIWYGTKFGASMAVMNAMIAQTQEKKK